MADCHSPLNQKEEEIIMHSTQIVSSVRPNQRRMNWRGTIATAISTVTVIATLAASPAMAESQPEPISTPTDQTSPVYSDRDMVDFLVFARGTIANDRPELVSQLGMTPVLDAPDSVTDQLMADLLVVDPLFHENVTKKAQANDPYEAEASLTAFSSDIQAVAAAHKVKADSSQMAAASAASGSSYAFTNYVVSTQVAVTAVLAASVLGVVAALVVFAYQHPADSSEIARQRYAASWSAID